MRRGNASWINETRKKARRNDQCQFLDDIRVYSGFKDTCMLRSMFIYMTIVRLILA